MVLSPPHTYHSTLVLTPSQDTHSQNSACNTSFKKLIIGALAPSPLKLLHHESKVEEEANVQAEEPEKAEEAGRSTGKAAVFHPPRLKEPK